MIAVETMSVEAIKAYLKTIDSQAQLAIIPKLVDDQRKSVRALGQALLKQQQKAELEHARLAAMWQYEYVAYQLGYLSVAGTDEVGRGPLAGPVVAAAVILPQGISIEGVNDSKKLSHQQRERLFEQIITEAVAYAIAEVDHQVIDEINILQASRLAMAKAIAQLAVPADYVLVDGLDNPLITLPNQGIIKGDSKSISIAAASIVAKVYRDRLMTQYHQQYPQYGFDEHKGYPTASHIQAIEKYGPCPIHRLTFRPLSEMKF